MNRFQCSWLALVLAGALVGVQNARGSDGYRKVAVHVTNPLGSNEGLEVSVYAVSRASMNISPEWRAGDGQPGSKMQGWRYRTDAQGNCTVRLGRFNSWQHRDATGIAEPGYGTYFLLVQPQDGTAGGVSPRLLNLDEEELRTYQAPQSDRFTVPGPGSEWNPGQTVLSDAPAGSQTVEIEIKRGFEVSGKLVDLQGHPVAKEQVRLWSDLGADTHTGRGGEIFEQFQDTDRAGRFRFRCVYPNLFYLSLRSQESDALYWIKSRLRERWAAGITDAIWPHEGETELPVMIVVARRSPYCYYGRVMDEDGRPVRGAKIVAQASIHGPEGRSDFDDSHSHHARTTTRQDGSYALRAAGPCVNSVSITAPGFQDGGTSEEGPIVGHDLYEELPYEPGRYDFVLRRK